MRATPTSTLRMNATEERERSKLAFDRKRAAARGRSYTPNRPAKRTLEEVGNMLGISKEAVRQIENHALEKIRRAIVGADE